MFSRIAVVNRGEPAVRLIRAVHEMNEERGFGITVIAVHTEAEQRSLFVRLADESVCLRRVDSSSEPYLDHEELERALRVSRADAVWVGWGFVAEDPAFAELCGRLGLVFIGAPVRAMRQLGDKIEARVLAEKADIPVAPCSGGAGSTSEVEGLLDGVHRIEVQVIADTHGTIWAPGVRDCSIQRNNQTVVAESGSLVLGDDQKSRLCASSIALMSAGGYQGVGAVEYLYQPHDDTFVFLGVSTGLQMDHPVTEVMTGLDLVKLQLLIAAGERLSGEPPVEAGHAIEVRLDAEDADAGFAPAPGTVVLLNLPSGPGIRVDTGLAAGEVIVPGYDSRVAKVIAWGRDRREALARLRCALREMTVLIKGGTTTKSFLIDLLDRREVVSGGVDIRWLDRVGAEMATTPARHADIALLSVAIDMFESQKSSERALFLDSARGGRPRARQVIGRSVELDYKGQTYAFVVAQVGLHRYRVQVRDRLVVVDVARLNGYETQLVIAGRRYHVSRVPGTASLVVEVDGFSHRVVQGEAGLVRAPAPAVVVAVRVKPGDEVEAGASVAVLESMKMETAVRAPRAGIVREVLAVVNSQVDAGVPLLRLDRLGETVEESDVPAVDFEQTDLTSAADEKTRALRLLADLHSLITGYEISATRGHGLVIDYLRAREAIGPADNDLLHGEVALMTAFADVCDLSRNRPAAEEESIEEQVHSPGEHFHTYLHSLDVEREKLPDSFRRRLARALRHNGVIDLARSPELEEGVYRLYLAQQGAAEVVPVVAALLERWLSTGESLVGPARAELGDVIDRLVTATQLRYPLVGDLARSIRFQLFEQPRIQHTREQAYAHLHKHLDYLDEHPEAADRPERIEAMVATTEPLVRLLAARIDADRPGGEPLLEVLTRRYYKIRTLENVQSLLRDDRQFVTGSFDLNAQQLHLIATMTDFARLPAAVESVSRLAQDVAEPANLVIDLYVSWNEAPVDTDEVAAVLRNLLADVPLVNAGRRVTVTVFGRDAEHIRQVTLRPSNTGLQEDRVIRDMHPMTGQRLNLWRLKNFNGTRLPSAEDTYLFRSVAKDNPADERLVAFAEIRDVSPLRDVEGRIMAFPAIVRALAACVDGIRRHQAQQKGHRLNANLIFLDIWPTVECSLAELTASARGVAPLTSGAGIEQIVIVGKLRDQPDQDPRDVAVTFSYRPATGITVSVAAPSTEPVPPLDAYTQKVRRSRARGATYPYELIPQLTGAGSFVEHDLDGDGRLVPVLRPPGQNTAGIIVGVIRTPTVRYPEGMTRVALFGDPTKALGAVAEAECSRVIAALDLAEQMRVPLEWYALSSGAEISMARGTENMDWVARGLRRLITFTQNGGEVNVVVAGINVGAQPYWNAEATMLMHTKGILIMTPDSAMVLTGKQSLDYSGGVSAEDNYGIGGYDRVMGPNGQAQYWAPNLTAACKTLFAHYEYAYVAPGESSPRRGVTTDPSERDVCAYPHHHPISDFTTVGDIFSAATNRERKKPFDIRTVMRAVVDQDHAVLERWAAMADAATTVVFDAYLGGYPVAVLGIESRPIPRSGAVPADGPDLWTAGTLFPSSAKKAARAINAASGNRPLVVLANLSGFDGSPESLRKMQLEYGAEIGRAIVNFDGPIVFCVISRYHGGAFVVFSGVLNDNMEVVAVEGSFASVIGGAPAAAVVFAREVNSRTAGDPRIVALTDELAQADDMRQAQLRVELADLRTAVRSAKLGEVAEEFEHVHNVERALAVGSVHAIIAAHELRPYLIGAVERGISRATSAART